jgi:hypothetical protein
MRNAPDAELATATHGMCERDCIRARDALHIGRANGGSESSNVPMGRLPKSNTVIGELAA